MKRNKLKKIILFAMLTISITIICLSSYSANFDKTIIPAIKEKLNLSQTEKLINDSETSNSSFTMDTNFSEFVKSDGTTYNIQNPDVKSLNKLEFTDVLYGKYKFNYTGAASIEKSIVSQSKVNANSQYYSKLSTIEGYEWIERFEKDNTNLVNSSGTSLVKGNSSAAEIVKQNEGDKIYKAYLVIGLTDRSNKNLLQNYPITLIGPKQNYIETKLEHIRKCNTERYSGYIDITEFVAKEGYGWYYVCNIPYFYNTQTVDQYASWKIIVIEENENLPIKALSLKLGGELASSTTITVDINVGGIKSKSKGDVNGQILYSIDGGDDVLNSNFLKFVSGKQTNSQIYTNPKSNKVLRTNFFPLPRILTRNGSILNTLEKYSDELENNAGFLGFSYTYNGKKYTVDNKRMGSDGELIDIGPEYTENTIKIGNSEKNFSFSYTAKDVVLQATALGLAMDIEYPEYETEINSIVSNKNDVHISGYTKNVSSEKEIGLHETKSIIEIDKDIEIDSKNLEISAYFKENDESEKIQISPENIIVSDHKITISWGKSDSNVAYSSLLDYKMSYEITGGLSINNIKEEFENKINTTGYLYSSNILTDIFDKNIAEDISKIKYTKLEIIKEWKDDTNKLNLRPDTIEFDLYKNDEVYESYVMITDKQNNNQSYYIDVVSEDSGGKYDYTISEKNIELANGDKYISKVEDLVITNTLSGNTEIIVTKVWNDKDNEYNTRPDNLKIRLYKNQNLCEEYNLNIKESENSHTFINLDKYDSNGILYNYSVEEDEIEYYKGSENNYVITNELKKYNYKIEYYYDGICDETKTEILNDYYNSVVNTYEDKNVTGYKLDFVENLPLTISKKEDNNIIKVYYEKETEQLTYKVEYFYDNIKDESKTEINTGKYQEKITSYIDKEKNGYKLEKVENLPLIISNNSEENVIKVYYVRKDAQIVLKYVDKVTGEEVFNQEIKNGKVFDKYDLSKDVKQKEGYTLIEKPNPLMVEFTEAKQEKIFYYAKNAKVIVKFLEKDKTPENITDNKVLSNDLIIEGYEGKEYKTSKKDIAGYTFVESTQNTIGKMTVNPITVVYYYSNNKQVVVNHIDKNTGEKLEVVTHIGVKGEVYTSTSKDFKNYLLVEKPEKETVIMADEVITLNYYYVKFLGNVLEKHVDKYTNEILYNKLHEGNEGDIYKINPKEFAGYDLVIEKLPENSEGIITSEPIEVTYYYERKASVKISYINKATGEKIIKDEYIYGHEGDSYITKEKTFGNYRLLNELYPENAKGKMQIIRNIDGTIDTEIEVIYYYEKTVEKVIENHIDIATNEILKSEKYIGVEGDYYKTTSKEIEGYDLVQEKLPVNAEGTMKKDVIQVNYYYIRKVKVTVEYIDKATGNKLTEDIIIQGHENEKYVTERKEFEGYKLEAEPSNKEGNFGKEDIIVRYYYMKDQEANNNNNNNNNNNTNNGGNNNSENNNANGGNNSSNSGNNDSSDNGTTIIKPGGTNNSNNNSNNSSNNLSSNKAPMPSTGDVVPVIAIAMILLVGIINIVQIVISKKKSH